MSDSAPAWFVVTRVFVISTNIGWVLNKGWSYPYLFLLIYILIDYMTQRLPGCVTRRVSACTHLPHREGNSMGWPPFRSNRIWREDESGEKTNLARRRIWREDKSGKKTNLARRRIWREDESGEKTNLARVKEEAFPLTLHCCRKRVTPRLSTLSTKPSLPPLKVLAISIRTF